MPMTQEDIEQLKKLGIDPGSVDKVEGDTGPAEQSSSDMGIVRSAAAPVEAHAGSLIGGGLGGLGGMAAASWLLGPEVGLPASIVAGIVGGVGGGYLGGKAQQAVVPDETQQALEREAQQAYAQHPIVSRGSELVTGALLGGGRPSLKNIGYAFGRGLPTELGEDAANQIQREAIGNVLTGNAINTGAQTGLDITSQLYNTGTVDLGQTAKSAAEGLVTGALFTNPNWLGKTLNPRWHSVDDHIASIRAASEGTPVVDDQTPKHDEILDGTAQAASKPLVDQMTLLRAQAQQGQANDSDINNTLRIQRELNNANVLLSPKQFPDSLMIKEFKKLLKNPSSGKDNTEKAAIVAENNRLQSLTNEQKRQQLYANAVGNIDTNVAQAVQQYRQHSDSYVDFWKQAKGQQDVDWVKQQNDALAEAEQLEKNQEAAKKQREDDFQKAQDEQQRVIDMQTDAMQRQRELEKFEQSKQEHAMKMAQMDKKIELERVKKTNLPENAEAGKLNDVARPETKPAATTQVSPTEIVPKENPSLATTAETRTPEEEIQDRLEGNGAKYAPEDRPSLPYGYWIAPDGKLHPVETFGHEPTARRIIRENNLNQEALSPTQDLLNKGYGRVINEGGRIEVESDKSGLTNAQRKQLKDLAIEHDAKAIHYPLKGHGRTETLHDASNIMAPASRFGETPLHPDDVQHLVSGKATVKSMLSRIALRGGSLGEYANKLLIYADSESLNTPVLHTPDRQRSTYMTLEGKVKMAPNAHNVESILHEALHALTVKKLPLEVINSNHKGDAYKALLEKHINDPKTDVRVKELLKVYLEVVKKLGLEEQLFGKEGSANSADRAANEIATNLFNKGASGHEFNAAFHTGYGLSNVTEMMAHYFASPEFRTTLDVLKSDTSEKTFGQRIKDAIAKLFGFNKKQEGTLFDAVHEATMDIIKKQNAFDVNPDGSVTPRANSPNPADELTPALRRADGEILPGERGGVHQDIYDKQGKVEGLMLKLEQPEHGFMRNGEFLSREEAAKHVGETTPLQSERLREMQSKEEAVHNAPPAKPIEEEKPKRSLNPIHLFKSGIDRIKEVNPKLEGPLVAKAFTKEYNKKDELMGRHWQPISDVLHKLSAGDSKQVEFVLSQENKQKRFLTPMLKNMEQKKAYRTIREITKANQDHQISINEPVMRNGVPTKAKHDPFYYPTTMEQAVGDDLRAGRNVETYAKDFKENYLYHQPETTPEGLDTVWKEFLDSVQGSAKNNSGPTQTNFNAIRQQAGVPLPDSMRRRDLGENLFNYFNRSSRDMAHYEHIEADHKVSAALGYNKDAWGNDIDRTGIANIHGNEAVKAVLDEIRGEVSPLSERKAKASEGLAASMMLGPGTEIHKIAASPFQLSVFSNNPAQLATAMAHAISNLGRSYLHAKENGIVVENPQKIKRFADDNTTAAEKLNLVAKALRSIYTLGGLTERLQVGLAQGTSEYLVNNKINLANEGHETSQNTMKQLDPDWVNGKEYSPRERQRLASRMAQLATGTKDARTMPPWAIKDNEISSFFKLMSWNVSQTNSFMKNAWEPMTRGDMTPLMMTVFGTTLGGAIIKELREKASGKPSPIASLADIQASSRGLKGNIPAIAYNWMSAASFGGLGGMISLAAKTPFDIYYRNAPQGAVFPLDEYASNYAKIAVNVADALVHDPTANILQVTGYAMNDLILKNTQLGRFGLNNMINAGVISENPSKALPEQMRSEFKELAYQKHTADLTNQEKHFHQVEGLPIAPTSGQDSNPYLNLEQKSFKHTQDIGEAAQKLPGLIKEYIDKYSGNPDVMMNKIDSLKANPYNVFPSLENTPLMFSKYLTFLTHKFGEEKASGMLKDYLVHKAVNSAKSEMVP